MQPETPPLERRGRIIIADDHELARLGLRTMLQPEPGPQVLEKAILLADEVDAEGPRRQAEADRLHAKDDEQTAHDQRMDIQITSEDRNVNEHEQGDERAGEQHDQPWQQEEKRRVVDENDTQVPPAIAKRRELRVADARMKLDRNLSDV